MPKSRPSSTGCWVPLFFAGCGFASACVHVMATALVFPSMIFKNDRPRIHSGIGLMAPIGMSAHYTAMMQHVPDLSSGSRQGRGRMMQVGVRDADSKQRVGRPGCAQKKQYHLT